MLGVSALGNVRAPATGNAMIVLHDGSNGPTPSGLYYYWQVSYATFMVKAGSNVILVLGWREHNLEKSKNRPPIFARHANYTSVSYNSALP